MRSSGLSKSGHRYRRRKSTCFDLLPSLTRFLPPLPARRRRNDKKEEREKDRGPLASGPVTVCHHAIRRLAAGAQYVAYTLRSTTPATPPKKARAERTSRTMRVSPVHPHSNSLVVTQEGGGVQVGAVEGKRG